jgi:hypothetical protein
MIATYIGPYEQVFPTMAKPGGGTLVLVPGEVYDFGDDPAPGPQWWWAEKASGRPARATESAPEPEAEPEAATQPEPPAEPAEAHVRLVEPGDAALD